MKIRTMLLNKLNGFVSLKPRSVGSHDLYLTKLKQMQLHNGIWVRSMRPSKYDHKALRICEKYAAKYLSNDYRLPKRAGYPFSIVY